MKYLLLPLLLLPLSFNVSAETVAGRVVHVSDGDTLTLDDRRVIRLSQIDAPEIAHRGTPAQPYGKEAKDLLSFLTLNKMVTIKVTAVDQYGRLVGAVLQNGKDINNQMLRSGAAWVYTQYNRNPLLPSIEYEAKSNRLGLWAATNPIAPWEYRKSVK